MTKEPLSTCRTAGAAILGLADAGRFGHIEWLVRVRCTPDTASGVAGALARRDDTSWVSLTAGGTEIVCLTRAPHRAEGASLLLQKLPRTPRVVDISAHYILHTFFGGPTGWHGKTGKWRTPRLVCDADNPNLKAIDSYIAEAKPDLVLHFGRSEERGEYDWRKRGQNVLPFSPLFDRNGNAYWGYDGFACFAAALDRAVNPPWRRLLELPWPKGDDGRRMTRGG